MARSPSPWTASAPCAAGSASSSTIAIAVRTNAATRRSREPAAQAAATTYGLASGTGRYTTSGRWNWVANEAGTSATAWPSATTSTSCALS